MAPTAAITPQAVVTALSGHQELNASPHTLSGGVYWTGADGNVYVKSAGVTGANNAPVDNLGTSSTPLITDLNSYGAKGIANPNPPAQTNTNTASNNTPAVVAAAPAAAVAAPVNHTLGQSTIDGFNQSATDANTQYQNQYNQAVKNNASADTTQQNQYNTQVQNNNEAHSTAIQNAEQAGARGDQGLRAVLASIGALNGTGQVLAGRAVSDSTNNDLGTSAQTYQTNDQSIQDANKKYAGDAVLRNNALNTALATDKQTANTKSVQDILNAANALGDKSTYNAWLPKLGTATAPISPLLSTPIAYGTPAYSNYASPSNLTVPSPSSTVTSTTTPVNAALPVKKSGTTS